MDSQASRLPRLCKYPSVHVSVIHRCATCQMMHTAWEAARGDPVATDSEDGEAGLTM